MDTSGSPFEENVFVNCPFDPEYDRLLKPLLFTVVALGYTPRIASERDDSGEQRIDKICALIRASKYSIHDLSRMKASASGQFFRMNMPFELGIDFGGRTYHDGRLSEKRFLILETSKFDFVRAISDLRGVDIQPHDDDPRVLVRRVRNWFRSTTDMHDAPGPSALWYDYTDFYGTLFDNLTRGGFSGADVDELPVVEFLDHANDWIEGRYSDS